MSNHYHLVLQTPEPTLVAGMQWVQNAYTRRFNQRHRHWGRLFGDRYKAVPVEGAGYYYETLLDYVHLNPVRAGLVRSREGESLLDFPWSSVAGGYALPPTRASKSAAFAKPKRTRCQKMPHDRQASRTCSTRSAKGHQGGLKSRNL